MKLRYGLVFYLTVLAALAGVLLLVLHAGKRLELSVVSGVGNGINQGWFTREHLAGKPVVVFFCELIVILAVAMLGRTVLKKLGQPAVMGEIVAGIVLGPSLLGRYFPGLSSFLFPPGALAPLQYLSQLGLIFFMFMTGMETDLSVFRKRTASVLVISHAGIAIPFGLGVMLAYFLYDNYAMPHIPFYAFSLFIGISMSVTAFPVLVSILRERGLMPTRIGNMVTICAAADDLTAWCILAVILALIGGGVMSASLYFFLSIAAFIAGMLFLVRPLLNSFFGRKEGEEGSGPSVLAVCLVVLLLSACFTELIGLHVLFGAFVAGLSMPHRKELRGFLTQKIEGVVLVLLLPLFYVSTGLRTQVGLLNAPALWAVCLLIILVAVAGKLGGCTVAAKLTGESFRDSLTIGALMNTRGLMELVVLNIGYDMGILSPTLFTMLIIMALVSTFMTNPLLALTGRLRD